MINEIENKITHLIYTSLQDKKEDIYFNSIIDDNMVPVPYIQISYDEGMIQTIWDREYTVNNHILRHKYHINQSMNILFVDNIKSNIYHKIENLLAHFPQYINISIYQIELIPNQIEYHFVKGILDRYCGTLKINITYPIISNNIGSLPMQEINIQTKIKESHRL